MATGTRSYTVTTEPFVMPFDISYDSLRQSWHNALNEAESHFRRLLTSSSSADWKHVSNPAGSASSMKGKSRVTTPELADVVAHRKASKSGVDIYRIVLDVDVGDHPMSLEPWKAVLATPELRQEWDPAVEDAHLVELLDQKTRICKTNFTLGWPANPRDVVTIARCFHDASTIIDISTSLPRSPDEPAYLRPSPPYVRSHVTLFAWCIQYVQPPQRSTQVTEQPKRRSLSGGRLRITCFWQHDLRALWNFGSSSGISQQLCTMVLGLLKTVKKRGSRVPMLSGYGNGVTIERIRFQIDREALTIDYSIIPEEDIHGPHSVETTQGLEELHAIRENRRLTRSIECVLPSSDGWDVRLTTKASSQQVEQLPWFANAIRSSSHSSIPSPKELDPITFRTTHSSLLDDHSILKVRVVIETSGPSSGLRLNGMPHSIQDIEERDPSSTIVPHQILHDVASNTDLSSHTSSSINTINSVSSTSSISPTVVRSSTSAERAAAAEKSVLSRVRRNYIYFSSLLQEPEAKWKRTTESRGVSVTQLDSIDPTLVVYRAEATFVGVGLWDLYGTLVSPGAKMYWDKQHEDAVLLEDVNELTELWHFKTRPAWPVNGRDSVVLKTVYKSPSTIHVFSFSADDLHLFPNIPPVDPNVIRIQVDLQGWAIEALSPTTTLLTLLEQSDPKGWTNKTSIPQQMVNHVAGIGDFAIKCGGPPVVSRLAGAKANLLRYDHERGSFKIEYEGSANRRTSNSSLDNVHSGIGSGVLSTIECELRCDVDTWASSLDIVVDPPPQSISCLRRHRLSAEGGGLWLSVSHDALFVDDERLLAIVRRGTGLGKEKGVVMVNGARVTVDVEELAEHEIKSLSKRKRVKPPRIPLDQPPVMGVIRRRRAEWDADAEAGGSPTSDSEAHVSNTTSVWAKAPKLSSPLTRFFTNAMEQATTTTQQAVAAIAPVIAVGEDPVLSSSTLPMQYALEALAWTQECHSTTGWTLVSEKGLTVHRRLSPEISSAIPVHKGEKVIEGVSAEELATVVTEYSCRKLWDDRFDSASVLESFGADCRTSFVVLKAGFPFRDRGFYVASVKARALGVPHRNNGDTEQSNGSHNAILCVSASFCPESVTSFSAAKYNRFALPVGRVFVDSWILETLDPYTTENYAIPSTRCTRLVALDYSGSIPAAVNSMINATLVRTILAVETFMKNISPLPITRLPPPGLVVVDKKTAEPLAGTSWKLRNRDDNRVLIATNYSPDDRVYHSTLLLTMSSLVPTSPVLDPEQMTPTSSKLILSPQSQGIAETLQSTVTLSPSPNPLRSTPSSPNPSRERLRSSSSAFTLKGEVRPSTDLLVAEIVVDSKLYPDGYDVHLRSRIRNGKKRISIHSPVGDSQAHRVLPITHAVHTMPSSPLHSSGLNTDRPTRHLLRFSLPTAQYQISTVEDPLTGEIQSAPPKPQWLLDIQEKGAVVDVDIRPAAAGTKREKGLVMVDGTLAVVVSEKESLTKLGRDDLQEDRISKMAVLARAANDAEPIPLQLRCPLAISEELLDPSASNLFTASGQDEKGKDESSSSEESSEEALDSPVVPATATDAPHIASSGLLGFLHSYPNPLSRFTLSSPRIAAKPLSPPQPVSRQHSNEPPGSFANPDYGTMPPSTCSTSMYPLSTIIVVALIAFLMGSLLRSLLSPADFIYVVTDLQEAEEGSTGWREIKRLLEVKYIVGGWDFQIAVVRRH